ncbi:hypothetical protein [Adhaeribacter soli]|uniref:GLPGLI family protein n=1 Tax=Adhaeribacter soli TaxID=2607655 RepID=A0A5N1IP19_9BACT|nr:hypothetical protein [Adhaeribacter soli]KAA9327373.1 hypothetical protein F0P94_15775 [Adhaeribacter soli]
MKTRLFFISLALFSTQAFAQTESSPPQEKESLEYHPYVPAWKRPFKPEPVNNTAIRMEKNAKAHIAAFKDGVLLVRLRTSEIAIKKLEDSGNKQMAASVRQQREKDNQKLAAAFRKHFTFCPVYFFYSYDSEKVKAGQFTGIMLDHNLKPDSSILPPDKKIYISEITELEQYRQQPDLPQESNNPEVSFKALVIRDGKFHQLAKPFPYFIKASTNIPPRKRSETEMVMLLDKNLQDYYKATNKTSK